MLTALLQDALVHCLTLSLRLMTCIYIYIGQHLRVLYSMATLYTRHKLPPYQSIEVKLTTLRAANS